MTNLNWQKIEEGVAAASEIEPSQRSGWLDDFCGGDEELRNEIESLLEFETVANGFLEQPMARHAAAMLDESHNTGRVFGNYEIEREIGHGGMGAVYLARRTDGQFEQQVALKIIRGSVADSRMIERFRQERQILASLNHPNIAKLLDGGVSASGEPFLAMEYIDGETITDFVARTEPSVDEILALFVKVCPAVSYAHRSLVVHRDIKPGNILVTADGEPKLLDFGLAKLAADEPGGGADQTETIFRALTPAYASPEQFLDQPITTASDIYSLGVLLFELLTGQRPFDLERKPLDQIITTITVTDPPLPSSVAAPKISSQLKGDLDTIIHMALRKEPERRYASVGEFTDDIERYLKRIPVKARPQTAQYRAGKFIRRHRLGAVAGALILIALLAGTGVSLWQARQARMEKIKAEAVSEFLQSMLSASSPTNALKQQNNDLSVKDLLDEASRRLNADILSDQSEVKATLQQIIGTSYLSIGQYDRAEQNLNAAYESQRSLYGEDAEETLKTLVMLASLWTVQGNTNKANEFYEKRISILRDGYRNGRVKGEFLALALNDYALIVRAHGDSETAEAVMRESIEVTRHIEGAKDGVQQAVLALTLADQGKFGEAESLILQTIEAIRKTDGHNSPELASNLTGLGSFQMEQGKYADAEMNLKAAEVIYRKLNAPTFLALGDNLRLQAQNAYMQEKYTLAETRVNGAFAIYAEGTSTEYVNYATALVVRGSIFSKTGRSSEGETVLREALRIRNENLPPGHYLVALTKGALAECLLSQNKLGEAAHLLTESFESLRTTQGIKNPRTTLSAMHLVHAYNVMGRPDLAAEIEGQIR